VELLSDLNEDSPQRLKKKEEVHRGRISFFALGFEGNVELNFTSRGHNFKVKFKYLPDS
jgi:hypothetical protein